MTQRSIFLFLFYILGSLSSLQAQYPDATLSGPRDTMRYFLKTMKGHKLGDEEALNLAIAALDLSKLDQATKIDSGRLAAQQLINTFDRLEYIRLESIPKKIKGDKWTYTKREISIAGKSHPVEISISQSEDKKWRFGHETVASIAFFEKAIGSRDLVKGVTELVTWKSRLKKKMPIWTGNLTFVLLNGQWLAILFIVFLAFLIQKISRLIIGKLTKSILNKRKVALNETNQNNFTAPIGHAGFSLVWISLIPLLELPDHTLALLLRTGYVVFTISAVVSVYQLVDVLCLYLEKLAKESQNKFDDILVPLIRKTAKFFVVCIGIIFIGNSLTLDMKSIIAGMGIGGIAFALAAKDTISNLFGSLTVLLDRPFSIGDWVLIDGNIEGTVEEVGMRSTRIRTFYDSLISLPNGRLTNAHIDNYGHRTYRRFTTKIGVQYDTPPEKIEAFCEGIRQLIVKHPNTRKDYFHVYFSGFNNSSLDILLYVFWRVPDWSAELSEKHRLLMDILRLGNKMGIEFAFPTQTLHMFQEQNKQPENYSENINPFQQGLEEAASIVNKPISPLASRSGAPGGELSNLGN